LYITLVVHHPKGPAEKAAMMGWMPGIAEEASKHKGFVNMVVAEMEDEQTIIPFSIWETEEDFMAARAERMKFLLTHDFSVQEGPTRAGGSTIANESFITTFKVRPVSPPSK
jgi:hypothetical protein